jgi:ParB-like chromosome segregation protein Spo0J
VNGENVIIAGHGRLLAASKLGMDTVPTIILDHLTDAQRRAYIIADNKLALNAGWDDELLALELGELSEMDFDIDLVGFSEEELSNLLRDANEDSPISADLSETVQGEFELIIECDSEMSLEEKYSKAKQLGWSCRTSIL